MSYGASSLVGSVTRTVTVGFRPGPLSTTFSTSYWKLSLARSSGSKCTWSARRPRLEVGPWQVEQLSSVAATPPWPAPVSKFTALWHEPQASRLTVRRQLLACGVSASLSSWQVWQLRWSCVNWMWE